MSPRNPAITQKVSSLCTEILYYLWDDRTHRTETNGSYSNWRTVTSGGPQGSLLGHVMFIVFISEVEEMMEYTLIKFTDDTDLGGSQYTYGQHCHSVKPT